MNWIEKRERQMGDVCTNRTRTKGIEVLSKIARIEGSSRADSKQPTRCCRHVLHSQTFIRKFIKKTFDFVNPKRRVGNLADVVLQRFVMETEICHVERARSADSSSLRISFFFLVVQNIPYSTEYLYIFFCIYFLYCTVYIF
jgi:hypothetical protein